MQQRYVTGNRHKYGGDPKLMLTWGFRKCKQLEKNKCKSFIYDFSHHNNDILMNLHHD